MDIALEKVVYMHFPKHSIATALGILFQGKI